MSNVKFSVRPSPAASYVMVDWGGEGGLAGVNVGLWSLVSLSDSQKFKRTQKYIIGTIIFNNNENVSNYARMKLNSS